MAAYKKGGFALLNELMERPPRSMEQVLHPEKYLGGPDSLDEPVPVELSETRGAEVDFEGRLGELLIQVLLRGALPEMKPTSRPQVGAGMLLRSCARAKAFGSSGVAFGTASKMHGSSRPR